MKHDFNNPQTMVIPRLEGMPCECVDCVKNAVYTKQLTDRNSVYQNSFDFPDWNDLKISATELLGRATGNPIAISTAQNAKALKTAVKKEVQKVKEGKPTSWTNLPKDGSVPAVDPEKLAPTGVTVDWLGWVGWKVKLVIALIIIALIAGVYFRAKG